MLPLLSKSRFRLKGDGLPDGDYQGCWNGRTITINHHPWTIIHTSQKTRGWKAVRLLIIRNKVKTVTHLPTVAELATKVDVQAETKILWWPGIELLKCLEPTVVTYHLEKQYLKLLVRKEDIRQVLNILTRNQNFKRSNRFEIWAPRPIDHFFSIQIVWRQREKHE